MAKKAILAVKKAKDSQICEKHTEMLLKVCAGCELHCVRTSDIIYVRTKGVMNDVRKR